VTGNRLLYAPSIHQGGGRALLLPILGALKDASDVTFVLDARMPLPEGVRLAGNVYRIKATLFSRLCCEWRLRKLIMADSLLLCMGNLPPLFAHQGVQRVFVQNRYLIDDVSLVSFPLSVRIRLMVERWWLKSNASYVQCFIVQTPTMQRLIGNRLGKDAEVLPFAAVGVDHVEAKKKCEKRGHYDFVYVASGEPHKNHKQLIKAWIKLAEKDFFPSLCLTLDSKKHPDLCAWINAKRQQHDLKIEMTGELTYQDIQQLYCDSKALIYPSFFESFGLPLLEAAAAGLPIAAADVEYVYDVIKPTVVFDPDSPESIANSVMHFTGSPARIVVKLLDAEGFLMRVFGD